MKKTIIITGSTDGIGLETAERLVREGHNVLIHGRNQAKIQEVEKMLSPLVNGGFLESYKADLSDLADVQALADAISKKHTNIDVLINNAGVYNVANTKTKDGLDVRFVVNTIAPYLLTKLLMPLFNESSRVVNLSSAAQAPVSLDALRAKVSLSSGEAYAQSKLAITMWTYLLSTKSKTPMIVAINPKSLLGSKMVKEAYGINGGDLSIGADILCRGALSDEFADASGKYFDNDIAQFAPAHPYARDEKKCNELINEMDLIIKEIL